MQNKRRRFGPIRTDSEKRTTYRYFVLALAIVLCGVIVGAEAVYAKYLKSFEREFQVDGISMEPTLHNRQLIIGTSFFKEVSRGDIVIFPHGDGPEPYVKSVVAIEGDRVYVRLDTREVYLQRGGVSSGGAQQKGVRLTSAGKPYFGVAFDVTVGKNEIFVMGDNYNNSNDSCDFGPIEVTLVQYVVVGIKSGFTAVTNS